MVIQGNVGNINSLGDFFLSMGIGALSAVAGGLAGQVVAGIVGTIGFWGGALTGAAGGAVGGFISGSGNAWISGYSFRQGLVVGLKGGGVGAITAGLIGGVSGGFLATEHGGSFWTGKNATFDEVIPQTLAGKIEIGEGMEYSDKYARSFSDEYYGENVLGVNNLYANEGSLPQGYTKKGDIVYSTQNKPVRGTTVYLGTGKGSDVYLYKSAFTSKEQLYFTMGHEYLHAGFNYMGLLCPNSQHASISKWEMYQAKIWGFNESYYT